jgi:hypothetical protein
VKESSSRVSWLLGYLTSLRMRIGVITLNLEKMPWILRITCVASFLTGVVVVLTTIFPVSGMRINDETLSTAELWEKGYAPFLLIAGIAMTLSGIGILKRWGWSRWLAVLLYVFSAPIGYIYTRHHPNTTMFSAANLIPGIIWAFFFYWYLFYKQKKAFT